MSGFIAIIADRPERSVADGALARFVDSYTAIRGRAGASERVSAGGRARACVFARPDQGVSSLERRGDSWALCAGVAYHSRPLVQARLDELDGQFALLRYDAEAATVTLASDPLGMFGLFLAERDGLVYASTSALALAHHLRAAPSRLGLHTYLVLGYHCGWRTSWEGIERLEGGMALQFGPHRQRRARYWRLQVDRSVRRLGIAASVDRCIESSSEAVRIAGGGRDLVWCDLTGGMDTRVLVLLASAARLRLTTTTSGKESDVDARLGRRIAAVGGWDWRLISLPETWPGMLPERLGEAVGWGDGALEATQLAEVLWGHQVKAEQASGVLNGGGGEHFSSWAWQHEYGRSGRSGPTNLDMWVRVRMPRSVVSTSVLTHDPTPEVMADLRARMEPVIEPYLDEPRAVQADVLYMCKDTGHFGAFASAAAGRVDLLLPFYSRGSITTAVSVNPRYRFGRGLSRRLIERLDPSVAAIPTNEGAPATPLRLTNLPAFLPYYAREAERAFNRAAVTLLHRSFRRSPGVGDQGAVAVRAATVAHLGTDVKTWRTAPLYNPGRLADLLVRASRTDFGESLLFGRIITVELALRAADSVVV